MKLGIALVLLWCMTVVADIRPRPPARPCRVMVYLPWLRIPYPWCDMDVKFHDGVEYQVHNPDGHACEPWYGGRDYFLCHVTIDWDKATIDAVRYEGKF